MFEPIWNQIFKPILLRYRTLRYVFDLYHTSIKDPEGCGAHTQSRDCWAVAFGNSYNDEERCLLAGYDNGDVKLFDLRMNTVRWQANVGNGVCGVQFDRQDIEMNKFVVTCLESVFKVLIAPPPHTSHLPSLPRACPSPSNHRAYECVLHSHMAKSRRQGRTSENMCCCLTGPQATDRHVDLVYQMQ